MNPAAYTRVTTLRDVPHLLQEHPGAMCIAGGTTVVDLMKERVFQPELLIDISRATDREIEIVDDRIDIGALARMSDVADNAPLAQAAPMIVEALNASASPQLRNMATIGGNLLQRTRCVYFRDLATPCNKRERGAGCGAIGGWNRMHAVLGISEHCIATHPSDLCVALAAADAQIHIAGPNNVTRTIALTEFYRQPGETPDIENDLAHDEVITAVSIPRTPLLAHSTYLKLRDRASFEFALVSVAAALQTGNGTITQARLALGGVATKPWRATQAEQHLTGKPATTQTFEVAAELALHGAHGSGDNDFKIPLAKRAIVRALSQLVQPA